MMEEKKIDLELEIEFKSPFHIGSGFNKGKLVDSLVLVDQDGFPYLPASSLKGRLRANLLSLVNTLEAELDYLNEVCVSEQKDKKICKNIDPTDNCLICRLFGSAFTPGSLFFSDFKLANSEVLEFIAAAGGIKNFTKHLKTIRSANRIDRRLKNTVPKALFDYEVTNHKYKYQGQITGSAYLSDEELKLFKNSLKLITHLGAKKSRGLGRCEIYEKNKT